MEIHHLKIYCSRMEEQLRFYQEVLELPPKEIRAQSFQIQLGYSVLEFEQDQQATPYHMAFHISAGQEISALNWLKSRVEVLLNDGKEITDFPAWNARSIYFYDPEGNIVEFICRKDLFPSESAFFSVQSIQGISEIGLATTDVLEKFSFLQTLGVQKFSGDYERFCAAGDDLGLFIIIDSEKKDWIPTGDQAYPSSFSISFSCNGSSHHLTYTNERLQSQ